MMRSIRDTTLFLICVGLHAGTCAHAEPSGKDPFFKNDYVTGIGKDIETSGGNGNVTAKPSIDTQTESTSTTNDSPTFIGEGSIPAFSTPIPSPSATGDGSKEPNSNSVNSLNVGGSPIMVKSIGLIVDTRDTKDLEGNLQELIDVAQRAKLPIGEIYVPGGFMKPAENRTQMLAIAMLGGSFPSTPTLPSQYSKVSTSPTWVVETDQGEILVEGFKSLSNIVTSNGDFVQPRGN